MKSLDYHESTKHSWGRIRANPHSLDFANMPHPFKIYSDVARRLLPTDLPDSAVPTLAALAQPGAHAGGDRAPGRNELARLLSAVGITKRRRHPGGEILFRGASCTGALYHIEVYVVCADLKELPAGVYQFQPQDFSLCLLRAGDYRQALVGASGAHTAVAEAPVGAGPDEHVVAQRLEVPSARLSPRLVGLGLHDGQPVGAGGGPGTPGRAGGRLCRRTHQPVARRRS